MIFVKEDRKLESPREMVRLSTQVSTLTKGEFWLMDCEYPGYVAKFIQRSV